MTTVTAELSISLDGYAAGPEPSLDDPLGKGGMQLHEWAFRLAAWRSRHGLEGGETGPDSVLVEELLDASGAYVMGRKMFSGGAGTWSEDPNANGWWGDEPPFHAQVFVVTHHEREPLALGETTFAFVTDGVAAAVERAREAAGGKDVHVSGGAEIVRQSLEAGLVDELVLHVAPLVLGGGTRFEGGAPARFEIAEVVSVPQATHVRLRLRSVRA
jgi:dihydrofolate reductase